ncbi:MAG TPA: tetratricopeptide repeat protein [Burkholderiales bacterium]|nr:tetratricopeptide repeat protein [Burkholderiales bacterium]
MNEYSFETDGTRFETDVLNASHVVPVVVDFWAPWCVPCRALKPTLEKLVQSYGGRFLLAKVNTDEQPEIAIRYGVRGIPNVKAFVDGKLAGEFTGALSEGQVREFIEALLPSVSEKARRVARVALAEGDFEAAESKLSEALQLDATNDAARVDLAELLVARQSYEDADRLLHALSPRYEDERITTIAARIAVWKRGSVLPDLKALRARIDAAPDDLDARQAYAERLIVERDYAQALEMLLGVVARARDERREPARKAMLDIFNLASEDRELVSEYRRRLAGLLH